MKITLSKPKDPHGRHVVLVTDEKEFNAARSVIWSEVLQNKARPIIEKQADGTRLVRFAMKYMDRLGLAFPMAELSPGIRRRLMRVEEKRLEGMPIPKLKIPGYTGMLLDYQKVAVAALTDPDYAASIGYEDSIDILNDEMGLGKTYIVLAALALLGAYPSILAVPNNAKYPAWAAVIEEFYPKLSYVVYDTQEQTPGERAALIQKRADLTIVNIEAIRARPVHENPEDYRTPIVGYDYANPDLFDYEYDIGVLDEHHLCKTPHSQTTRGFFQLEAARWIPMSGTPILNRPEEWWPILHKLYPEKYPSYDRFVSDLGIVVDGRVVAYRVDAMSKLRDHVQGVSLRRRKDQVLKDLPPVTTVAKHVVLSTEERRLYNLIEDKLALEMEDGTVKNIGGALPKITRLKQACFSPELYGGTKKSSKVEELKRIVTELVASGEKAIIFSQWEKACVIIKRELEQYNPAYVTGKIKNRLRVEEIRKFMEDDDCYLYIGTIGANREAINLGIATYVIFTDEGWVPAGDDQAIGRSAAGGLRGVGLGPDAKVTVIMLRAEDTYEEHSVIPMKEKKRALFDRTVERDGGKLRQVEKFSMDDLRRSLSRRNQRRGSK